ncbi:hypothetical protein GYB29_13250 [bacterium]|jgi:hypothetical protein|nr:hypothetical protein [bacterium]
MKLLSLFLFCLISVFGLANISNQEPSLIGTKWLMYDFGDCQDILSFKDSTFTTFSCELSEESSGRFWIEADSVFLFYPEIDNPEMDNHQNFQRPKLWKLIHENDQLKSVVIIRDFNKENQSKFYVEEEYGIFTKIK